MPANVNAAVLTALQKLPADRFASAAAMSDALQDRAYATDPAQTVSTARSGGTWNRVTIAMTAIAGVAGVAAVWAFVQRPAPTAQRTVRVVMALPDSLESNGGLALSPDGSRFVFNARKARPQPSAAYVVGLWLRSADQLQATEIAATQSVMFARFAPDGRHIGTVDATSVLKVREFLMVAGKASGDIKMVVNWPQLPGLRRNGSTTP